MENVALNQTTETFIPRPAQARILEYTDGPMGVSAVPGSGKTFTLSLLAAQLVERLAGQGQLDNREVLIVTFTNSAVENFRSRIGQILRQSQGLLAVGLSESFDIVDERTANEIKRDAAHSYLRTHPDVFSTFILPDYLQNFRRIERYVIDDAIDIANAVIRLAKDLCVAPHELQAQMRLQSGTWPLLDFGLHIYADYQRSLFIRGAVDFDDLIGLALQALDSDADFLARLQERWPYVLEDEAQDSSRLQERMLRLLTNDNGNWVRVGDPNQAINTTFTSANPRFLRDFVAKYAPQSRNLPNSGRSALPIIKLANSLIQWSRTQHPVLSADEALSLPEIEPTPEGDPQPNPEPGNPDVLLYERDLTPDQEIEVMLTSLRRWLPQNMEQTVAVLVPENHRGFRMANALEAAGIPYDDSLLRSGSATRAAAQALSVVLNYITQPHIATHLERVWLEVWWPRYVRAKVDEMALVEGTDPRSEQVDENPAASETENAAQATAAATIEIPEPVQIFGRALRKIDEPETLLFPSKSDWLDTLSWMDEVEGFRPIVEEFRADLRRWTQATILPVDELLLTLGNALFTKPADLALTHRLAILLAKLSNENPTWRLPELAGELENVAQNKRRILGFNEEGLGFEPKAGQVTLATMHAAKGLEWDRVYLTAVNNYGFPSGTELEKYRGERWFVRDNLNLVAEAVEQVAQLQSGSLDDYTMGQATEQARRDIGAERLRLLYVGITPERDPNEPALAFRALAKIMNSG